MALIMLRTAPFIPTLHFAFLSVLHESSSCSTSLPVFGVASVLDFGHSSKCVVVSNYCFSLNFPNDTQCEASVHMLICHLYMYIIW